ncbi:MAG: hypothetical protein KGL39_59135, partial [Patescibacteria group bacterium]|nr:hypothetical protein [Patescibacteria group bacterium]
RRAQRTLDVKLKAAERSRKTALNRAERERDRNPFFGFKTPYERSAAKEQQRLAAKRAVTKREQARNWSFSDKEPEKQAGPALSEREVQELAKSLGMAPETVRRMAREGRLTEHRQDNPSGHDIGIFVLGGIAALILGGLAHNWAVTFLQSQGVQIVPGQFLNPDGSTVAFGA